MHRTCSIHSHDEVSDLEFNFFRQGQKLCQESYFLKRFWPLSNCFEKLYFETMNYHHILRVNLVSDFSRELSD